ncbi:MAG: metal ABC transporter permease, partial [Spirochaetaceae bacterium]|nr:metal ABC transporter permease [Spirochaetaceae bacterium]
LLALLALAIVLLQNFVGIVMVIAMLTLPAGSASNIAKNLVSLMVYSALASALFSAGGLVLGWALDLPVGAER